MQSCEIDAELSLSVNVQHIHLMQELHMKSQIAVVFFQVFYLTLFLLRVMVALGWVTL